MKIINGIEVCNLKEYLDKYAKEEYIKYLEKESITPETIENMKKVFVIQGKDEKEAILINTYNEGKLPEGKIGTYNLEENKFVASSQVKIKIIETLGIDINSFDVYEQNEIIDKVFGDMNALINLNQLEFEEKITEKAPEVKELIQETTRKKNEKAGHSEETVKKVTGESNKDGKTNEEEPKVMLANENTENSKGSKLPEDVEKACARLGITQLKGYYYVNPVELGNKIDNVPVNKYAGRVLILEESKGANVTEPDRYYGVQDEKLVLYGGKNDEAMEEITERGSRPPVDGSTLSPLKKDNGTYVEYSKNGINISEKIEEKFDLSYQELEEYKKKQEELLDKFASEVNQTIEDDTLSEEEKNIKLDEIRDENYSANVKLGQDYGIDYSDTRAINAVQVEEIGEAQDTVEEETGEKETGDIYDDSGKLLPPNTRIRE